MATVFKIICSRRYGPVSLLLLLWLLGVAQGADPTQEAHAKEPEFSVRGLGFWGNLRWHRTLELFAAADRPTELLGGGFVEDATWMLLNHMVQQGHLQPGVSIRAVMADGQTVRFDLAQTEPLPLARTNRFRKVRFRADPGRVAFYEKLEITGLAPDHEILSSSAIRNFYYPTGFLFRSRPRRVFTEGGFRQSNRNLREALKRKGYRDASVAGKIMDRDEETGAVGVSVHLDPGLLYRVRELTIRMAETDPSKAVTVEVEKVGEAWSRLWEQDTAVRLRNRWFAYGYADTRTEMSIEPVEDTDGERIIDVVALVRTDVPVEIGDIILEGRQHTGHAAVQRRLMIESGDLLDPLKVEHARRRLARMGSFDRVAVQYRESEGSGNRRDVLFAVEEVTRLEVSLLGGYGSYELLRGGLEMEQRNLWGEGHRARLMLVQSMKSTEADYVYTVPELTARQLGAFGHLSLLRREELDFRRQEVGGSTGLRRYFTTLGMDFSLRYVYEFLRSERFEDARDVGRERARVAALSVDLRRDRSDNPVYPEQGSVLNARVEMAAQALGGEAEYLLWEFGGALHRRLGGGRVWHGGLSQGFVHALGAEPEKLPFNKRFFPGGDRSQRGYRFGEAASLNEAGKLIGSTYYMLFQNEFEQALTPSFNLLIFCDLLHISVDPANDPDGDVLVSVGLGLRYQTIVGPVRLEYGHNLRRRDEDPHGQVHLSLGFPF